MSVTRRRFLRDGSAVGALTLGGCAQGPGLGSALDSGSSGGPPGTAATTGGTGGGTGPGGSTSMATGSVPSTTGGGATGPGTGSAGDPTTGTGTGGDPAEGQVLGVALVGLGSYSTERLAPALQLTEHCRLTGIVTGSPEKIPVWQDMYGIADRNVYDYDTMDQIASNEEIDVVYIVVPTGLHAEFAIRLAQTGKHIWLEKPMAMSVTECQQIIDACRNAGVKLSLGYRMQHEPNTQTVIEYARTRPYGQIQTVTSLAGYFGGGDSPWRLDPAMGGGALYDMGVYTINGIRYATGEEPIRVVRAVQSTARPDVFPNVDETTEFDLEFASGIEASARTSTGETIDELVVECERGSYELRPMQAFTGVRGSTSDGVQLDQTIDNQQARQMEDNALAILRDQPVLVPGEEGLADIRVLEAIRQSAQTGQPVDIV